MDDSITLLILGQSLTFLLLVISETLPFTSGPTNGILHAILIFFKVIKDIVDVPRVGD